MFIFRVARTFCALLLFSLLLTGCSSPALDDAPERAITFGAVSFSGNPIVNGRISFIPEKGPTAMGPVKDGKYRIESKGGVPVGLCKVQILGYKETGKEIIVGAGGKSEKELKQVLPAKYNAKSTLKVTVQAGEANHHDFDLK